MGISWECHHVDAISIIEIWGLHRGKFSTRSLIYHTVETMSMCACVTFANANFARIISNEDELTVSLSITKKLVPIVNHIKESLFGQ